MNLKDMKQMIKTALVASLAGFSGAVGYKYVQEIPADRVSYVPIYSAVETTSVVHNEEQVNRYNNQSGLIDFTEASKVSTPSVVYIKSIATSSYNRMTFSDLFFGNSGKTYEQQMVTGSGSGVVYSEDGYIITNNHVIDGAEKLEVVINKRTYSAEVVGKDASADLALLKVEGNGLPAIRVASSRGVKVGEWVLAVGNPFNLESTVTGGIVSAKGRHIGIMKDRFPIESFIQTDAAINPGNSGGALVNMKGELIGINTAILSQTGSYAGYGFAIPSDIVIKIIEDLKKYGQVQKAVMGVQVQDGEHEIAQKLGLSEYYGVIVHSIDDAGAAKDVGIKKGDLIIKLNDETIDGIGDYDEVMAYHRPGDTVQVGIVRGNEKLMKEVVLTNLDGTTSAALSKIFDAKQLGALLETVPKIECERLGIPSGVRIKDLQRNGLIRRMGLDEGVIVMSVNRYVPKSPAELTEILEKIRGRVYLQAMGKDGRVRNYAYYF